MGQWPSHTDPLRDGDDPPHGRGVNRAVILERPGLAEDPAEGLSLARHAGIPQAGVRGGRVGALPDDPPNLVPSEMVRLLGRKAKLTILTRRTTSVGLSGLLVDRWSAPTTVGASPTRRTISPAMATRMAFTCG